MWFSVLRKEIQVQDKFCGKVSSARAGTVWRVSRCIVDSEIAVVAVLWTEKEQQKVKNLTLTVEQARLYFTKPTKDFSLVMEESFMVCEAVYC